MSITNPGSSREPEQKGSTTPLSRLELAAELLARVAARCASSGVPGTVSTQTTDTLLETDTADEITAEPRTDTPAPQDTFGSEAR